MEQGDYFNDIEKRFAAAELRARIPRQLHGLGPYEISDQSSIFSIAEAYYQRQIARNAEKVALKGGPLNSTHPAWQEWIGNRKPPV